MSPLAPAKQRLFEDREVSLQRSDEVQVVGRPNAAGRGSKVCPSNYDSAHYVTHFLAEVGSVI